MGEKDEAAVFLRLNSSINTFLLLGGGREGQSDQRRRVGSDLGRVRTETLSDWVGEERDEGRKDGFFGTGSSNFNF